MSAHPQEPQEGPRCCDQIGVLMRRCRPPHSRGWWRRRIRRMMEGADVSGEVNLLFTDDEGIRSLNRRFRGVDAPTDVLSFGEGGTPPGRTRVLGDIVISLQRAEQNAPLYGQSVESELLRLVVHGFLHLLGHDHETDHGEMGKAESRLMRAMRPTAVNTAFLRRREISRGR